MTPVIRRALKAAGAALASGAGADRWLGSLAGLRYRPLVLGYHRVVEDFAEESKGVIPAMLISVRMLERHLDWVGRRYRYVGLDELAKRLEEGDGAGPPLAAVTFDDGYRDFFVNAFPLLRRKGIPAAVFVVTDQVGTRRTMVHDALYRLLTLAYRKWDRPGETLRRRLAGIFDRGGSTGQEPPFPPDPFGATRALLERSTSSELSGVVALLKEEFPSGDAGPEGGGPMTWSMLRTLQRAGVTIGSHTRSHAVLSRESLPRVRKEIAGSRRVLERRLGTPVRHLAYPDGGFNGAVVREAAAAGYRLGVTLCRHFDPRFPLLTLPRKALWENSCLNALGRFSPSVMSCHAGGLFELTGGCREVHG